MCLIAFAIGASESCPLLLASNRDEFFDRPTAPLERWALPAGVVVLSGRDLRDGGTWLGISEHGRVAMLTNVRSARAATGRRSRGELCTRWLAGDSDVDTLAQSIVFDDYGGFNLVVGDLRSGRWHWLGNRDPASPHDEPERAMLFRQALEPGVHGLSNAALNTPWPKTQRLRRAVADALDPAAAGDASPGRPWVLPLAQALGDTQAAPEADFPDTGVAPSVERALSSPFVQMAERGYGTRSSLVLRVRASTGQAPRWQADLHEWTHAPEAPGWSARPRQAQLVF